MPEHPVSLRRIALCTAVAVSLWAGHSMGNSATLDFEELPAVDPATGVIPTVSLLDTQYLASHGVRFRTWGKGAVAVVRQTNEAAAIGDLNGISGVYDGEDRSLAPGSELVISFWVPTNTGLAAVTDYVRLRVDPRELKARILDFGAYGVDGNGVGATYTPGEDPETLEIRGPGIHSIRYLPADWNPAGPIREVSFGPLVSSLDSRRLGPIVFEPAVRVLRERYAELRRLQRPLAQWPLLLERIRIRRALVALQNPGRTLASQCRALARAQAEMAGYMDNARLDEVFERATKNLYGQVTFRLQRLYVPVGLYRLLPDDSRIDPARRRFEIAYKSWERGEPLVLNLELEPLGRVRAAKRQAGALAFARAAANVPTLEASAAFIPKLLSTGTLRQFAYTGQLLVSTTGVNMEGGLIDGKLHIDTINWTRLGAQIGQQRVRMTVLGITGPGTYYPKAAAVASVNDLCFGAGTSTDPTLCCSTPSAFMDIHEEEGYARLDITHVTSEFVAGYYFFYTGCWDFVAGIFKLPHGPTP